MNQKSILTILALAAAFIMPAQPLAAAPDREMTVKIGVDGMVCAFCAQGLLAHFRRHEAVRDIHVDLDRKLVILAERKGKSITDKEINDAVKRAGFDPGDVRRVATPFEEVRKSS